MCSQTCQNISTAPFATPEYTLNWNRSALSCDFLHTVCTCVLWAVCFQFYHHNPLPLWLTSCSICCGPIKQTEHINCIDSTAIWQLLRTCHIWFPLEITTSLNTHIRVHPSCWLLWSVLLFLEGRWVIQPSTCYMYVYVCVWLLCSFFFMPFLFNLHMPTWGKRPYHRVRINELLCCAQPV